jgi:hypothetical protein
MPAVIPDVNALATRNVSGVAPVSGAGPIDRVTAPNPMGIGAKVLEEIGKRKSFEEVSRAKTQLQIARIQEDGKYDQDQDPDTMEERWIGNMTEQVGKASSHISEGGLRQQFVEDTQATMAQGQLAIKQFAFKKKADMWGSYATGSTDILLKGAVREGGDVAQAMSAIEAMWASGAVNGYTSHENAQAQTLSAKYLIAESKIKALPAREQLKALKEDWAEELPNHIRVALEKDAQKELVLSQAQRIAYQALSDDMNAEDFDHALFTNPDLAGNPNLIVAAQEQFTRLSTHKLNAQVTLSGDLYQQYDERLRDGAANGTFTLDMFMTEHRADWKKLTPPMRNNLKALEREAISPTPRQHSNMAVYEEFLRLWGKGGVEHRDAAKQYYYNNSAELNHTDRKTISKIVYNEVPESLFEWQRLMQDEMAGMSTTQKANAYSGVNRWYLDYQKEFKVTPDDKLVNDKIHKLAIKYSTGIFGSESVHSMDLPDRISAYGLLADKTEREEFLSDISSPERKDVQLGWLKEQNSVLYTDIMADYVRQGVKKSDIVFADFETLFVELLAKRQAVVDAKRINLEEERQKMMNVPTPLELLIKSQVVDQ